MFEHPSPREHLNLIQQRWLTIDPNAGSTTANLLDDVVRSIFGDAARIGYELLQNADDASETEGLSIDIEYFLLEEYLVIRHNGAGFSTANVEALCRYGSRDLPTEVESNEYLDDDDEVEKQRNLKKIGYKGIGFKSVFNIADQVWVISRNGYQFRFDKEYWNGQPLPWQIVPIESNADDLPIEIAKFVSLDHVNFILKIRPDIDQNVIKRKIATLFKDEQILLFLPHTRSVDLQYFDPRDHLMKSYRKITRKQQNEVFTLSRYENHNLTSTSNWQITHFEVPIPTEITQSVQHLDQRRCPEKLKTAKTIEISFAAKLANDGTVNPQDETLIFSYLPTQKRRQFPYFVNSNFLLNEARTELLNERWNEYLFEQIGYLQFEWFRQMAHDPRFRFEFAGLLKKYADTTKEPFLKEFNKGVAEAQIQVAYVPVLERQELQKSPYTIVDKTKIGEEFDDYILVKESFETGNYDIAHPKIKKINKLISVGAQNFDQQKLREAIRRGNHFVTPSENIRLLQFFHKRISQLDNVNERDDWNQVLVETPFLLSREMVLREPPNLYSPDSIPDLSFDLDMEFLHDEVFQQCVLPQPAIRDWLNGLGMTRPTPIEIIRRGIIPLIQTESINVANTVPITRFIYENWAQLHPQDLEKLTHLPVLTKKNNLKAANFCYLADGYEPQLALELHIDDDIYISTAYIGEDEEVVKWRQFWLRLKVREDMNLELHEVNYPISHEFLNRYQDYWRFLQPELPQFNRNARHSIYSLLIPRYLQYANQHKFALQYWNILLNDRWTELQNKARRAKFQHSNGQTPIPSYFEFLIATYPCFPATNGNCYNTTEVYSYSLSEIVGTWRPVSYFELTPQQEQFLGIRSILSLDECLALLTDLSMDQNTIYKSQISAIYRYILAHRLSEDLSEHLYLFNNLRLLSVNNTFQEFKNLCYFNLPRFAEKNDSSHFIFLDLYNEDALLFCQQIGLRVINSGDLEVSFDLCQNNTSTLEETFRSRLPYIALIAEKKQGKGFENTFSDLAAVVSHLKFFPVNKLQVYLHNDCEEFYRKAVQVWRKDDDIFFLEPWDDKINLYALCEILSQVVDLIGFERELEVLLTVPAENLEIWLQNNGYDTANIIISEDEAPLKEKIEDEDKESTDIPLNQENKAKVKAEEPEGEPISDISNREGIIKIPPEKATTGGLRIISTPHSEKNIITEGSSIDEKDAIKIGKWGEEYVYKHNIINDYYKAKNILDCIITWNNLSNESGEPHDFVVDLSNGDKHFWEVKSTPSSSKSAFPITSNEFQFSMEHTEYYFIIRIMSAGHYNPSIEILENPLELIKQGRVSVEDAKILIIR